MHSSTFFHSGCAEKQVNEAHDALSVLKAHLAKSPLNDEVSVKIHNFVICKENFEKELSDLRDFIVAGQRMGVEDILDRKPIEEADKLIHAFTVHMCAFASAIKEAKP